MVEPVGAALGVAGLITPAYIGVGRLFDIVAEARSYNDDVQRLHVRLRIQQSKFNIQCQKLFGNEVSEPERAEILQDRTHTKWTEIQPCLRDHELEAFLVIHKDIARVENELQKFTALLVGVEHRPSLIELAKTHARGMLIKRKWLSRKAKLGADINTLHQQIGDIMLSWTPPERLEAGNVTEVRTGMQPRNSEPFTDFLHVQSLSDRIYRAMTQVANCPCHRIDFQLYGVNLDEQPSALAMDPSDNRLFRLLLTEHPPNQTLATVTGTCSGSFVTIQCETNAEVHQTAIQDLCSCLNIRPAQDGQDHLGYITSEEGYCLSLYHETLQSSFSRVSLSQMFESARTPDGGLLLSKEHRYTLAWLLASAVLCHGSNPVSWFRQNWNSGDISFLVDQSGSSPNQVLETPLISASFGTTILRNDIPKAGDWLSREQLWSLTIALVEIACGKLFREGGGSGDPDISEVDAQRVRVGEEMGARYSRVVGHCVGRYASREWGYCHSDDKSPEQMQIFYWDVVRPLRRCMEAWKGLT